jgi:hypothetical protein
MEQDEAAGILAECRRQRTRAWRWVALTGLLAVLLVAAAVYAATDGKFHGIAVILIPVLLVINLLRLALCLAALRKIDRAERLVRDAQRLRPTP